MGSTTFYYFLFCSIWLTSRVPETSRRQDSSRMALKRSGNVSDMLRIAAIIGTEEIEFGNV